MIEENDRPLPALQAIRTFPRTFWIANVMEIFERLAYYGVRVVVPIYIASTEDPAGLHFTNEQKGQIFALWAIIQTLLPMFTGGYADRYGKKRTIAVAIVIKIIGYLLMATQRSYGGFMAGCLVLAAGTAIFKPGLWGTLAVGIEKRTSGLGWGIFYWLVNVGGFLGPPLAGALHRLAWKYVFFSCAAIVSLNFLLLLTYQDPKSEPSTESPLRVGWTSLVKLFTRPRLYLFILVTSGFWVMVMQFFDSLPNFIEEWTDSTNLVGLLHLTEGQLAQMTPRGLQVPQEWMLNLDSGLILLLMVPVAAVVARFDLHRAMVVGILLSALGLGLAGGTMRGTMCLLGIFVFAFGEMIASPKMYEYLGLIAPKGEEALYMGYANIPTAIGWTSGSFVAGYLYSRLADKGNLASRYLREHGMGDVPRADAFKALVAQTGGDARSATRLLFDTYNPTTFWHTFVGLGLASMIGVFLYRGYVKRKDAREAAP